MPRVVGIDPGTVSFDLCGLQDGSIFLERSVSTSELARRPETLVDLLVEAAPLDLVAGPSGYGLPLVPIEALGERDLELMVLAESGEEGGIGGMRTLVRLLGEARLPVVFLPGVIHLKTVPRHRKVNRVDLGTADKVCAAAFAIDDQARRFAIPHAETSLVLVELGGAFTAVLTIAGGRIVSGQGGSSGPAGYLGCGALDAEVAFLLGRVRKETVFSGGVAFVAGDLGAAPEAIALRQDEAARSAREAFVEGVVKAVAGELALVPHVREILLSGRLSRVLGFRDPVAGALSRLAPVRDLSPRATVKEAARGAALLADGLAGGPHRSLVEAMDLRGAGGSVLDHLYIRGSEAVRGWARTAS
jgi:predicted butyrate kinase (DUF1464 family)